MKTDYLNKVERGGYNQVQQDTTITSVDDGENMLEKNATSIKDLILPLFIFIFPLFCSLLS